MVLPTRRAFLRFGVVSTSMVLFDGPQRRKAPWFSLEGTSGGTRTLHDYADRVVLMMYEDRDSTDVNAPLKAEVRRRIWTEMLWKRLAVVPVADVRRYDYWPARAVVRAAVIEQAKALGTEILLDWKGDVFRHYGFRSPDSNVVLIGRDGALVYQHTGPLYPSERRRFHELLSAELAPRATRTAFFRSTTA
jgi:hypothetical protein